MRALEFGPLEGLISKFGEIRHLQEMPPGNLTMPSAVFKTATAKKEIVSWNPWIALELWKGRGPHAPQDTPDLFERREDLTEISLDWIGRDRLILKAKSTEELMYFTTDND